MVVWILVIILSSGGGSLTFEQTSKAGCEAQASYLRARAGINNAVCVPTVVRPVK